MQKCFKKGIFSRQVLFFFFHLMVRPGDLATWPPGRFRQVGLFSTWRSTHRQVGSSSTYRPGGPGGFVKNPAHFIHYIFLFYFVIAVFFYFFKFQDF
jgi:hypothetical protein